MSTNGITQDQLAQETLETVRQMSPLEKAELRKRIDRPLGFRERARLMGQLLCYRDAKTLIQEMVPPSDHRKRAITLLYLRTGGRNWAWPEQVAAIVEEAL